jgi:Topoisomerase 6 subunit A/Spo11, Toprim domain
MYAARPTIAQLTDRDLGGTFDKYFTQTLLPDYIAQRRPSWAHKVAFDARGHFAEPHTDIEIGLGTLEVRNYLGEIREHTVPPLTFDVWEEHYPTQGPSNRFGAILFCEKEGFDSLFEEMQLAARYDVAPMSTKGMSVTASRELVEALCATYNIPLLVLHDFDISGFSIFGTLRDSTRRFISTAENFRSSISACGSPTSRDWSARRTFTSRHPRRRRRRCGVTVQPRRRSISWSAASASN